MLDVAELAAFMEGVVAKAKAVAEESAELVVVAELFQQRYLGATEVARQTQVHHF